MIDIFNSYQENVVGLKQTSIQMHLHYLLNTRQGTLQHLPDYGLPDITEIYQRLPYSTAYLLKTIAEVIEKYEPRLKQVVVRQQQYSKNYLLTLDIQAKLFNVDNIKFATYFLSGGKAIVELI